MLTDIQKIAIYAASDKGYGYADIAKTMRLRKDQVRALVDPDFLAERHHRRRLRVAQARERQREQNHIQKAHETATEKPQIVTGCTASGRQYYRHKVAGASGPLGYAQQEVSLPLLPSMMKEAG